MVKIKLRSLKKTSKKLRKVGFAIGGSLLMTGLVSCGGETEYETTEVLTPSQGIVTEVKEFDNEALMPFINNMWREFDDAALKYGEFNLEYGK